jgi:hypothetical protein
MKGIPSKLGTFECEKAVQFLKKLAVHDVFSCSADTDSASEIDHIDAKQDDGIDLTFEESASESESDDDEQSVLIVLVNRMILRCLGHTVHTVRHYSILPHFIYFNGGSSSQQIKIQPSCWKKEAQN